MVNLQHANKIGDGRSGLKPILFGGDIRIRNVEVGQVRDAIIINFQYEEDGTGQFDPTVGDIRLKDCHFKSASEPHVIEHVRAFRLDNVLIAGKRLLL